ncbi:MAG: hypothetical protein IT443_08155 [Phycisphaeraceae bacterium]|nr:hypothetical protein [Phycisphaeraceae bacterium]
MFLPTALTLLLFVACGAQAASGAGDAQNSGGVKDADPTAWAAMRLIGGCLQTYPDGRHMRLLRAVRHLQDPELKPLYEQLLQSDSLVLKTHGFLGLAECNPHKQVDLKLLADVKDQTVLGQLVGAAMDTDLLDLDQARDLLNWGNVDDSVKVVLATKLIGAGEEVDAQVLQRAAGGPSLSERSLAAMLLAQMGDGRMLEQLSELDGSHDPERDIVRAMLLKAAMRMEYRRVSVWAYSLSQDERTPPPLRLLGLQTALRLGQAQARRAWESALDKTDDPAMKIRLAILALQVAPWVEEDMFEELEDSGDELLADIGRAGRAIASQSEAKNSGKSKGEAKDTGADFTRLVKRGHPVVNNVMLAFAESKEAGEEQMRVILIAVLDALEGPNRDRSERTEQAMEAVESLMEKRPDMAVNLIKERLAQAQGSEDIEHALLMGLVRCRQPRALEVVEGFKPADDVGRSLATLIRARYADTLGDDDLSRLGLIVRGGSGLEEALRLQAGWLYLKRKGQEQQALSQVLADDRAQGKTKG